MAALFNTQVSRTSIEDKLKKFDNIITVAKTGHGDFVCSDAAYTSDDQCIQAAIDHVISLGGGTVHINKGHYICTDNLEYTSGNVYLEGDGPLTLLDFSAIPDFKYIYAHGSISATNSLLTVSDANVGDLTINVADGTKFSVGNWIRIRSEAIFIEADGQTTVGEIQQIVSIVGNLITLREPLFGGYKISDTATVDLVNMLENLSFKNFNIISTPAMNNGYGISVRQATNVTVENVNVTNAHDRAIWWHDVVIGKCINCTAIRANKPGLGYGLSISNCSRDIYVAGNHYFDCRHGITCSGDHKYGVQYNQIYIGNFQTYDSQDIGMFGPHPTYDGLIIANNICNGCGLGYINGKNTIVIGNQVLNVKSREAELMGGIAVSTCCENAIVCNNIVTTIDTPGIYLKATNPNNVIQNNTISCETEGIMGIQVENTVLDTIIKDNNIHTVGMGISLRLRATDLQNSKNITIENNNIYCTGATSGIEVRCYDYGTDNVVISNNTVNSVAGGYGIVVNHNSGDTGTHQSVTIKNNKCTGGVIGIDLIWITNVRLIANELISTTTGIYITSSVVGYTIIDNIFENCTTPIADDANVPGKIIQNNPGYNPLGNFTAPALPASTATYTNNYGYPCQVQVSGGTVTEITLDGVATGMSTFFGIIPPGGTIAITYSSAPTWKWWGL